MPILGQTTVPVVTSGWWSNFAGDTVKQVMVLLGAIGIVAVFVVLWIVFIRKPKHQDRRKYPKYPNPSEKEAAVVETDDDDDDHDHSDDSDDEDGDGDGKRSRKHHGRRRRTSEHRPRNPTLAETGGLPPLREPGQPPPQ